MISALAMELENALVCLNQLAVAVTANRSFKSNYLNNHE